MDEPIDTRTAKLSTMVEKLLLIDEVAPARAIANEAFAEKDPDLKSRMIATNATVHPLAVPTLPAGMDASRLFNFDAWRKSIAMARIVAANTKAIRILFASAPKTGSTFLSSVLHQVYGLNKVSLTLLSAKSYGHYTLGGALRDHDVDELALLTNAFIPGGYIAHHHMICTPYLTKQMELYGITPLITKRNIFDTIVSYDDHIRKLYQTTSEHRFLRFGFPEEWYGMDFDDRIEMLLDLQLLWYMKYYSSWTLCEQQGLIKPMWIVYERDILGEKAALVDTIIERFGEPAGGTTRLVEELGREGTKTVHFNKGVSGRGAAITGKNRAKIEDFFYRFRDLIDFSDILDE